MEYFMKLPRNKKEFTLFILIISLISVNTIAPLITCFEVGFYMYVWSDVLKVLPFIWIVVVALVLITYVHASIITNKILKKDDSFNAHMIVSTLVTVFMMSIVLTVVGTWIGCRSITMEPIQHFFYKWPRNYSIALFVEMIIAQPIARYAMYKLHILKDKKK